MTIIKILRLEYLSRHLNQARLLITNQGTFPEFFIWKNLENGLESDSHKR